jgi:hypothetical protein
MKRVIAAIGAALVCQAAWAQFPDAGEFQRASTTHRLAEFPKIHKDGRVWHRCLHEFAPLLFRTEGHR